MTAETREQAGAGAQGAAGGGARDVLTIAAVRGVPEVRAGDDVASLLLTALAGTGLSLADGDVIAVSSKVISKAAGLRAPATTSADPREKEAVVLAEAARVVSERATAGGVTRIVQAHAGPVLAAAGVDASNVGPDGSWLLLPRDPDAAASDLRDALLAGSPGVRRLGVVVTDTAGRPWRVGQTDFALGAAGFDVLDDLRGALDADGRPLAVTARAVADELAAAADLVKGKAAGIPAALVRGSGLVGPPAPETGSPSARSSSPGSPALSHASPSAGSAGPGSQAGSEVQAPSQAEAPSRPTGAGEAAPLHRDDEAESSPRPAGAARLVRTGPGDWFALGHVDAVRAALGAPPGSPQAARVGVPPVGAPDAAGALERAVALATDPDALAAWGLGPDVASGGVAGGTDGVRVSVVPPPGGDAGAERAGEDSGGGAGADDGDARIGAQVRIGGDDADGGDVGIGGWRAMVEGGDPLLRGLVAARIVAALRGEGFAVRLDPDGPVVPPAALDIAG